MGSAPVVLVVDSDKDIRDFIEILLTDEGYKFLGVASLSAALALLGQQPPNVLLLDAFYPGIQTFVEEYYKRPGTRATIILMTTGFAPEQVAAELRINAYLAKPFNVNELLDLIQRCTSRPSLRTAATA